MKIAELKEAIDNGSFHHATFRDIGKLWEGLYIYVKQDNGFNGFTLEGSILKDDPTFAQAYELVKNTGYSVGSYGRG
jgi:hypothetical protein